MCLPELDFNFGSNNMPSKETGEVSQQANNSKSKNTSIYKNKKEKLKQHKPKSTTKEKSLFTERLWNGSQGSYFPVIGSKDMST